MSYDISDNLRLVSLTGFRDMKEDRKIDFDGTRANHITIERLNDYDQFSEELRLEGSWEKLTLVAGVYYWNSEFDQGWVPPTRNVCSKHRKRPLTPPLPYEEFETDLNPNDGVEVIEDASHLVPRNAPEHTYGVGGQLNYSIGPGEVEIFVKYSEVDEIETSLINLTIGRLDAREDLSASIGYHLENMSIVAYGRNMTDETFEIPQVIFPLFAPGLINAGETWGIEFSYEF